MTKVSMHFSRPRPYNLASRPRPGLKDYVTGHHRRASRYSYVAKATVGGVLLLVVCVTMFVFMFVCQQRYGETVATVSWNFQNRRALALGSRRSIFRWQRHAVGRGATIVMPRTTRCRSSSYTSFTQCYFVILAQEPGPLGLQSIFVDFFY